MDVDVPPRLGRVRSSGWSRLSHGLYVPAGSTDRDDLAAWSLVLPDGAAFTHLTAARAAGWWMPPFPREVPVFVAVPHGGSRPRREGLRVCRHPHAVTTVDRNALRFTTPAETLLACARDLGVLDLVVLVDSALHLRDVSGAELAETARSRRRGAPRLRQALRLADARSESPWETLLRILHVSCDVPVEAQRLVHDREGGFVARGDLWLTGTTTLHEYDGAHHREARQQRVDLARDRRIGHAGWTRRGYTAVEVLHQGSTILRDADRALDRPHRPERIRSWHALLAASTFMASGREQLRQRVSGGA